MIVDFDDFSKDNHKLELLNELHRIRDDFRCTLFTIPNRCSISFLKALPDWMELAVHGWDHPHSRECESWSYEDMISLLDEPKMEFFVNGFKAPGWQISDGCYQALLERGYWVADQVYNDNRRPPGLKFYVLGYDSLHGHIQDVCGNGLEETFDALVKAVESADKFQFVSEAVIG